ncbi:MAG TPA: hypothetical protein VN837_01130 [Chloroflexota bacterium]|nr:hypothetical protein [Chloroflexota bacterium]
MTTPTSDRDTIARVIGTWPIEDQVTLARQILQRATAEDAVSPRPGWREMAGIASSGRIPPSDEQVAQWLDEHRQEKYG